MNMLRRKKDDDMVRKMFFRNYNLKSFSLALCALVFSGCVSTPNGMTLDLNYIFFGKEDDINWTHQKLNRIPNVELQKLSNFTKEASNLYRYAERIGVSDNTWYQVFAKGMSVYFVYKNVSGFVFTYEVYKSKGAMPTQFPTLTPEELKKLELAYAQTVQEIKRRGRNLYINNKAERAAFIQRYQGKPNTSLVLDAKNIKLDIYDIGTMPQENIVALAKKEPNDFIKVRMIHDWVADIFAYDYDLLWWMDNVSGKNAEFTLGEIVKRQRGVCYEYAILFWFLMDAAGIEAYLISEVIDPENAHAYNMVVINGTGYIIDTTWDSGNKYKFGERKEFKGMFTKTYFMPDVSQSYRLRGW